MNPARLLRRVLLSVVALLLVATSLSVAPFDPRPADAVPIGIGPLEITSVGVAPDPPGEIGSPLGPGETVLYQVAYSCSGSVADPCEGAQVTHVFPTFTDIYGAESALEWVSSTSAGGDWSAPDLSTPGQVTWTATAEMIEGDSDVLTFTLRVPLGIVPPGEQTLPSEATLSLGGDSEVADLADPVIGASTYDADVEKSGSASTSVLRAEYSDTVTNIVEVCPVEGAATFPEYMVVDTLPPGAELVDAGELPPYATYDEVSDPRTVTWHLDPGPPPSASTGCIVLSYQVRYPNTPGVNEIGHGDDRTIKTNTVEIEGFNVLSESQGVVGTDTHTVTLIAPPVGWGRTKTTGGNYFVLDGDIVNYRLGASNNSDVDAPGFTTATMTDALPDEFTLTQIETGDWGDLGDTGSAAIELSTNDGGSWTQVSTAEGATVEDADVPGVVFADVTDVRWVFTSPEATMVRGWSASQQRLIGTVSGPADTIVANCMTFSGSGVGVSVGPNSSCASVRIEDAQPHPRVRKNTPNPSSNPQPSPFDDPLPANTLVPGQTIGYTIDVDNNTDATANLVGPRVADCVPDAAYLNVDLGGITYGPGGTGTWTAQHGTGAEDAAAAIDCADAGGTYLQFALDTDLTPGQAAPTIRYSVTAEGWTEGDPDTTPPGYYGNTATVVATGPPTILHCVSGSAPGTPAVDGACSDSHTVTVPAYAQLDSRKLVQGALDSGFNRAGTTTPGGQVTWRLQIRNVGNVSVEDVHYVDTLPHVGDTGVRRTDQLRGSEYDPYLVSLVAPPSGWEVDYSLSENPCRPEVLGPNNAGVNCEVADWTTTPNLANLSNYRSIRLRYVGDDDGGIVPVGAPTVTFDFDMVAPVGDPVYEADGQPYGALLDCTIPVSDPAYDPAAQTGGPGASTLDRPQSADPTCPLASNSFAYGVRVPADQLGGLPNPGILAAEPVKVDLHVAAPPGDLANGIGDRVWYDRNVDGVQDDGETGVPGVRVELYRIVAGDYTLFDTTFTDVSGRYLFQSDPLDVPDGSYVVRFYPPADHDISPQSQGDDSAVDSDVPRSPTDAGGSVPPSSTGGAFHETELVPLFGGEVDLTWDMGIWGAADAAISVDKVTKDSALPDSEAGDGVEIVEGRDVTWIYTVTNTGDARLDNVVLSDDGGPDPGWTVSGCVITDDGVNIDGLSSSPDAPMALNRGAEMRCTAEGVAELGGYSNVASVAGEPTLDDGSAPPDGVPDEVTDTDPSSYTGTAETTHAVGNVAWFDADRDGIQDAGELGVPDVLVELLDADGAPILDGALELVSTITDAEGRYVFDDLPAGSYRIRFSDLPVSYMFTRDVEGDDQSLDSNPPQSGITPVFVLGVTEPNMRPTLDSDGLGEALIAPLIDPTIDAGIQLRPVPPPPEEPEEEPETVEPTDPTDGGGSGQPPTTDPNGVGGEGDDTGDGRAGGESLPRTGADILGIAVLGLLAFAGGIAAVGATRRRHSVR